MRNMKRFCMIVWAALSLGACNRIVAPGTIEGTWTEQYDASVFALDGSVEYTFGANNQYRLRTYDALSGEVKTVTGHYVLDMFGENTITINPEMSDLSNITYSIVKLTSREMAWQRQGTTYSQGTWGSDYRHFVRSKRFVDNQEIISRQ